MIAIKALLASSLASLRAASYNMQSHRGLHILLYQYQLSFPAGRIQIDDFLIPEAQLWLSRNLHESKSFQDFVY